MRNHIRLTIITPTYNRADKLDKLYKSLFSQTNKNFEWLVIDDGSTDETENYLKECMEYADFSIRYEYQVNGGKHRALNKGIKLIDTELTFIVDSDDWLTVDAVDTILHYDDKYCSQKETSRLCGFSFLRAYSNGDINTREFPIDEAIDTYRQQRINNNLLGDKAEVYYTDIIKRFPFEEFEGEKFMPEDAVWLKMSGPYKMVHANRIIYYCDYLEGGLTKTGRKMKIYSPYGMMYRSSVYLNDPLVKLRVKIKMAILYNIYSSYAKKNNLLNEVNQQVIQENYRRCIVDEKTSRFLLRLLLLPSKCIFLLWDVKYV